MEVKELIEDLLSTASSLAYVDYYGLSLTLRKILDALVTCDNKALTEIIDAVSKVELNT